MARSIPHKKIESLAIIRLLEGQKVIRQESMVSGLLLALLSILLGLLLYVFLHAGGVLASDFPGAPTCWRVQVDGEDMNTVLTRRGECLRASIAAVVKTCEKEKDDKVKATCYEATTASVLCVEASCPGSTTTTTLAPKEAV